MPGASGFAAGARTFLPMSLRAFLVYLAGVAAAFASPPPQLPLLHYEVDLDAPPHRRFHHAWTAFLQARGHAPFADTYRAWHLWLQLAQPELFGTPERAAVTQKKWLTALKGSHPDAAEEILALSELLLSANASEQLFQPAPLATAASLYPILNIIAKNSTDTRPSACTSTLVRLANGKVLHGRSLDYEPRDAMAQTSVLLDFNRQGRRSYRCLYVLPYPTALQWFTCLRAGAFSLSVNARSQGILTEHNASFPELLRRVTAPGTLLLGEVAERAMQASTYEEALMVLTSSAVVSSNYYILAGADGRGVVVTRFGNASSADVWALESSADLSDGQPHWLRVQTNVDHWVPISSGAYATHRRQHVVELLTGFGQHNMDKGSLMTTYLTDSARSGSENRTSPEDTGVILRPTTIATVLLDPSAPSTKVPDSWHWRIWAQSPKIQPSIIERTSPQPQQQSKQENMLQLI